MASISATIGDSNAASDGVAGYGGVAGSGVGRLRVAVLPWVSSRSMDSRGPGRDLGAAGLCDGGWWECRATGSSATACSMVSGPYSPIMMSNAHAG